MVSRLDGSTRKVKVATRLCFLLSLSQDNDKPLDITPKIYLCGTLWHETRGEMIQILKSIMADNFRRALMAFPDEDVLVGSKFNRADSFEAYKVLVDQVPRPGHKATGEERAWGRRLAKRFAVDATYDDQSFRVIGDASYPVVFDHESSKPEKLDPEIGKIFKPLKAKQGDFLITFGWIMAEELLKY